MKPKDEGAILKKVAVSQLRVGMFLQRLEGSWLQHPFWRRSFLLEGSRDVQELRGSGVQEAWIDLSRGLDVAPHELAVPDVQLRAVTGTPDAAACEAAAGGGADVPQAPALAPHLEVPATVSMQQEIRRARDICENTRKAVVSMFGDARMGRVVDASAAAQLVEDITASVARNPDALISMARLKARDDYTYMHSVAVCALMVALARQLGQTEPEVRESGLGGLLHDLGKSMMPLEVLNKPGALTSEEFAIMKAHPSEGCRLLANDVAVRVRKVVLHHHEKYDGSGYPERLAGEEIDLHARMGAICDVYDALTSDRPYKKRWDPAYALRQMASWKGHFDPRLFHAFVKSLGIYPVGSLVRLASDRLAVVVEQNTASLLHPVVRAFYSVPQKRQIDPERIDLRSAASPDRIIGVEDPAQWSFKDLDSLWMQ